MNTQRARAHYRITVGRSVRSSLAAQTVRGAIAGALLGLFACQANGGDPPLGAPAESAGTLAAACAECAGRAISPTATRAASGANGSALAAHGGGGAGYGAAGSAWGAADVTSTGSAGNAGNAANSGSSGSSNTVAGTHATPAAGSGGPGAGTAGMVAQSSAGAGPVTAGTSAGSAGTTSAGPEPASCQRTGPVDSMSARTPRIYIVGDSTASVYGSDLYPRMGWGQPLQDYFEPACASVQDKALSGRSSKSFYDEGAWTPIRNALGPNDFVLIQFGHNDEKSEDAARYTAPFTTYQSYLTKYIDDTQAKAATAILLTSIERNKWSNGKLGATHGDYPEAVRQLAHTRNLTLVDMTALTHQYFERIGAAATDKLFMNLAPGEYPNYPSGNSDDTHLREQGARSVADIALAELARQRTPLAALLKQVPSP